MVTDAPKRRSRFSYVSYSPPPRVGLSAHLEAIRTPFPTLLASLREIIGDALVAYIADASADDLNEWIAGERFPDADVQNRLRVAYGIAAAVAEVDGPEVTQAWMVGANPSMPDWASPARALQGKTARDAYMEAVGAVRTFLNFGSS